MEFISCKSSINLRRQWDIPRFASICMFLPMGCTDFPWFSCHLKDWLTIRVPKKWEKVPSGPDFHSLLLTMDIEMLYLPIKDDYFPVRYVSHYQRVYPMNNPLNHYKFPLNHYKTPLNHYKIPLNPINSSSKPRRRTKALWARAAVTAQLRDPGWCWWTLPRASGMGWGWLDWGYEVTLTALLLLPADADFPFWKGSIDSWDHPNWRFGPRFSQNSGTHHRTAYGTW